VAILTGAVLYMQVRKYPTMPQEIKNSSVDRNQLLSVKISQFK
jgi:hypothetical protein